MLLEHGADANFIEETSGDTSLIAVGGDLRVKNKQDKTPADLARELKDLSENEKVKRDQILAGLIHRTNLHS